LKALRKLNKLKLLKERLILTSQKESKTNKNSLMKTKELSSKMARLRKSRREETSMHSDLQNAGTFLMTHLKSSRQSMS